MKGSNRSLAIGVMLAAGLGSHKMHDGTMSLQQALSIGQFYRSDDSGMRAMGRSGVRAAKRAKAKRAGVARARANGSYRGGK